MSSACSTKRPQTEVEREDPRERELAQSTAPPPGSRKHRIGIDDADWKQMLRALKEPTNESPADHHD